MDDITIYLWIIGGHSFFAFIASINICTCPLRSSLRKVWLLLFCWLVPYVGSVIIIFQTDNELPYKGALKSNVNSNNSTYAPLDISDSSGD